MEKWIHKKVNQKIEQGKIPESERDLYVYGYTLVAEKLVIFLVTMFIAIVFNALLEVLLLCITFVPLREYTGGYHANSRIGCNLLSAIYIIVALLGIKYLPMVIHISQYILGEFVCAAIIFRYAPVATDKREISESENRFFRKMTLSILAIELILGIIFSILKNYYVMSIMLVTHMGVAAALLGEMIKKGRYFNEKCKKVQ